MIGNTFKDKSSFIPHITSKKKLCGGFTLIELLVVVAIIAILSVFVILTINPAELLKQGRDSQRVSDIATINSALNLYQVDAPNGSLGAASTTYISIPDNTATSTQGTQCQGLSLPALPTGWTYHCAASSTYRNTDGTGWIPVNFTSISYGSPLGTLPTDPINSSSTAFYTYTPGGSWQLTAIPESQKIRTTQANQLTGAITQGSNLSLSPLFSSNGLVGYWKFDEASGATSTDSSGNGNNGTWNGTGTHWGSGKVGGAAQFTTSGDIVTIADSLSFAVGTGSLTISFWVNTNNLSADIFVKGNASGGKPGWYVIPLSSSLIYKFSDPTNEAIISLASPGIFDGTWHLISFVVNRGNNQLQYYKDGAWVRNDSISTIGSITNSNAIKLGFAGVWGQFLGSLDDLRIYNRALSAAEIMALYNATK